MPRLFSPPHFFSSRPSSAGSWGAPPARLNSSAPGRARQDAAARGEPVLLLQLLAELGRKLGGATSPSYFFSSWPSSAGSWGAISLSYSFSSRPSSAGGWGLGRGLPSLVSPPPAAVAFLPGGCDGGGLVRATSPYYVSSSWRTSAGSWERFTVPSYLISAWPASAGSWGAKQARPVSSAPCRARQEAGWRSYPSPRATICFRPKSRKVGGGYVCFGGPILVCLYPPTPPPTRTPLTPLPSLLPHPYPQPM